MELNEFEYQMLDTLLAAFGPGDELSRAQVLELFDGDETFAAAMISVLTGRGLVAEKGELLQRLPKAAGFLQSGGFAAVAPEPAAPLWPAWDEEALQKKNTELQNETLRLQRNLRGKDADLATMTEKAGRASFYQKGFYAALALIAVLAGWVIWLLTHQHRP